MSKTIEQVEQELDQKIPRSVVSERDGGGGRRLSYLEGQYVIDRLNKVFGHLSWNKEILEIKEVVNTTSKGQFPAYLAKVKLTINFPGKSVVKEGYGYGADKSGQNAHELAIKEAVTDGLKVAAKDLGMSMGLALYSKTQENVDEEENGKEISVERGRAETPAPSSSSPVSTETPKPSLGSKENLSVQKVEETVRSYVRIADKQKRMTSEQFKSRLHDTYKVSKLAELSLEQMLAEVSYLQGITK